MPIARGKSQVVSLTSRAAETTAEVPVEVTQSPLYGVAMLKIAMELKKADAKPLDELIHGVLSRMGLDEAAFRAFLDSHGGLLRTVAQRRSY